jgi:hypothetical protein
VACTKLGRRGIGIEISEKYFEIAAQRVRDAYAEPYIFLPNPRTYDTGEPAVGQRSNPTIPA